MATQNTSITSTTAQILSSLHSESTVLFSSLKCGSSLRSITGRLYVRVDNDDETFDLDVERVDLSTELGYIGLVLVPALLQITYLLLLHSTSEAEAKECTAHGEQHQDERYKDRYPCRSEFGNVTPAVSV
jgi:hypothetical protein